MNRSWLLCSIAFSIAVSQSANANPSCGAPFKNAWLQSHAEIQIPGLLRFLGKFYPSELPPAEPWKTEIADTLERARSGEVDVQFPGSGAYHYLLSEREKFKRRLTRSRTDLDAWKAVLNEFDRRLNSELGEHGATHALRETKLWTLRIAIEDLAIMLRDSETPYKIIPKLDSLLIQYLNIADVPWVMETIGKMPVPRLLPSRDAHPLSVLVWKRLKKNPGLKVYVSAGLASEYRCEAVCLFDLKTLRFRHMVLGEMGALHPTGRPWVIHEELHLDVNALLMALKPSPYHGMVFGVGKDHLIQKVLSTQYGERGVPFDELGAYATGPASYARDILEKLAVAFNVETSNEVLEILAYRETTPDLPRLDKIIQAELIDAYRGIRKEATRGERFFQIMPTIFDSLERASNKLDDPKLEYRGSIPLLIFREGEFVFELPLIASSQAESARLQSLISQSRLSERDRVALRDFVKARHDELRKKYAHLKDGRQEVYESDTLSQAIVRALKLERLAEP